MTIRRERISRKELRAFTQRTDEHVEHGNKWVFTRADLSSNARLILWQIINLSHGEPCWARREYFVDFFNLGMKQVRRALRQLVATGYIERHWGPRRNRERVRLTYVTEKVPWAVLLSKGIKRRFLPPGERTRHE